MLVDIVLLDVVNYTFLIGYGICSVFVRMDEEGVCIFIFRTATV